MDYLKHHPFAVEAFFDSSVVLTFAIPKELIQDMIPYPLELDTHQNKWAFIAIAIVKTRNLRPKGFPKFLGHNFQLIGYRIFVRYTNQAGKRMRGLYILKSETDKQKMVILGNLMTTYKYTKTDINISKKDNSYNIISSNSNIDIKFEISDESPPIPVDSPFTNWKEARRFAGPLPFTFSVDKVKKNITIIEGVRENWVPKPIHILSDDIGFLKKVNLSEAILASAFIVQNIPYFWEKGKIELW